MIRIVFMDIDGTLIPYGAAQAAPESLAAIRRLQEKGILVFAVTGRCACQVPPIDFDGIISYDGACIQDRGKTILKEECFDQGELDLLARDARSKGHRVVLTGQDQDPVLDHLAAPGTRTVRIKRPELMPDGDTARELAAALEQSCFDKGLVAQRILEILKIPAACSLAMGDGYNDMSMLAAAGISAAMKEAPAEVQACADFTADGVPDALKQAGLLS